MSTSPCIYTQKDKQKNGKSPQGRTTITKQWKRYTNYRSQPQHHSNINEKMKEKQIDTTVLVEIKALELQKKSLEYMQDKKIYPYLSGRK